MTYSPKMELIRRAIRSRICALCPEQSEATADWAPARKRECEAGCTVFLSLPELVAISCITTDNRTAPFEKAILEVVCQDCRSSPTAGDYCADRLTRICPLSRYGGEVLDVITPLLRRRLHRPRMAM